MTTSPLDDPALPDLVSAAIERLDQGLEPQLDEICRERPDLAGAVEQSLELAQRLPTIQRESASHDRLVGRVLDSRYRLDARLGAGAMGVVYRGEDLELQRPVAVKILRSALLSGDESEFRFAREAEVMAAVRHPSVVTIYDRGHTGDDDPYLVMELLEGAPLSDLLEQGKSRGAEDTVWIAKALGRESLEEPSYLRTVVRWAADLASGLSATHEADVFHRDVKPSNVFVGKSGRPMLLDFGIAARVSQATLTREGQALGTPAYMAPESLEANYKPHPALDIYGLGATLYHMLTLRPPFAGTPSQILSSLVTKEPTPAFRFRPGLPRDLQAILDRSMARRPSARYASMADFEADLRAFLDYRPVSARPVSSFTRYWRRAWRSSAVLAGVGVAAIALAIFGGVQWRSTVIAGRRTAFDDVWRLVDPNLTIMSITNRVIPDPQDRARTAAFLDRAARLSLEPIPAKLIRSSHRLDHGDARGAAADMAEVARSVGTPYAREFAACYDALASDASSVLDLDTSELPEPVEPLDVYLAGYHLMRSELYAEALPLLQDPRLEQFVPAQELLLVATSAGIAQLPASERMDPAQEMYEGAVRLEEDIGHPTATTAHLLGSSLLLQQRYDRAREAIGKGLDLAPRSHQLLMNAGMAAYRLDLYEEARGHIELAIQLRPDYFRPYTTLVRVLRRSGDFDDAEQLLRLVPVGDSEVARKWRSITEGDIETEIALEHRRNGEPELAVATALLAVDAYEEARTHHSFAGSTKSTIAAAMVAGDLSGVFASLAALLEADPTSWRRIESLLDFMPDDLTQDETAALRSYLLALRDVLAQDADYTPNPPLSAPR